MAQKLTDILKTIDAQARILIFAHIQPDGDALGSCFALQNMLSRMGKTAHICCDSEMPHRYADLFPTGKLKSADEIEQDYDLVIALDCAEKTRLGSLQSAFDRSEISINIDHHATNGMFADINYVAEASSVGEIIFDLMRQAGIKQDENSAKFLYIAISTDTGNFTYSNTSRASLSAVAELVALFDLRETADILYRKRTLSATQLIGRAIASLETFADGKIAFVSLSSRDLKAFGASGADTEDIVNYAREIEQTQVAAFFRDQNGGVKVSLRSSGSVDVSAVAAAFGGGGHANAAGCDMTGSIKQAKKKILAKLLETQ